MNYYDYKKAKKDIENILNDKTEIHKEENIPNDKEFKYDNGIRSWVGALFIDIVNSTDYFQNKDVDQNVLSRIIRSLIKQLVTIISKNGKVNEIGIRGDCVYGIFSAPYKGDLLSIFRTAYRINTFFNMFNTILSKRKFPKIKAGIGLGCDEDLIIKVGVDDVKDKVWIGSSIFNASNLSKIANRGGFKPICMDSQFYINIIGLLKKENVKYEQWIERVSSPKFSNSFYQCNIVQTNFSDWIDNGMKDE